MRMSWERQLSDRTRGRWWLGALSPLTVTGCTAGRGGGHDQAVNIDWNRKQKLGQNRCPQSITLLTSRYEEVKTGALREYHFTPKVRSDNGSVVDKIPHQIKLEFHKQTVCVVDAFAEKCFIKHWLMTSVYLSWS